MCYKDIELMAYLDGELSPSAQASLKAHLAECPRCRQELATLQDELGFVTHMLQEYRKSAYTIQPQAGVLVALPDGERKAVKMNKWKKIGITLAAAAAVMSLAIFTPIGAMAADLLNVFRVEKFIAINVTPQEMEEIRQALEDGKGTIDLDDIGTIETSGVQKEETTTLEEAKQQANWPFLQLPAAGEDYTLVGVSRTPAAGLTFKLDVAKANAMIGRFGGEKLFPESLSQKPFSFTMPTQVSTEYRDTGGEKLMLTQGLSPEVSLPEGTDIAEIRDVVLSLPFIPETLRSRLAAIGDWRNAAIIPAMEGESEEITVRGKQGLVLYLPGQQVASENMQPNGNGSFTVSGSQATNQYLVMWQENGVIYTLYGSLDKSSLLDIAERLE